MINSLYYLLIWVELVSVTGKMLLYIPKLLYSDGNSLTLNIFN